MNPLLLPELREMIQEKDEKNLRQFLERLLPAQAADLIEGLKPDELTYTLDILQDDKEAEIFCYLPEDVQFTLAAGVGRGELAKLVSVFPPDDRVEFIRKLPPKIVEEMLPLMAQAQRNDIKRLLSFPEGTAGARMTTEYASIPQNLTCGEALDRVRHEAPNKETIYSIYVVDEDRHLEGVTGLKDLLLNRPETPVSKIMRTETLVVRGDEPATKAAEMVKKYDLLALPITDEHGRLLGIVTIDDLVDVMEREATKDILSMGAVEPGALDKPYFETPTSTVVKKRVGWLLLLFVTETLTGTVLRHYDEMIANVVSLSFFVPLLIGTGGNAGSQTVSTIIRSLALKEITPKEWMRIVGREAYCGFMMGLLLGVVGVSRSLMWNIHDWQLATTVGITIVVICTWSNATAAMVPLFAQRSGLDPTVLSAPLIATFVDATGLLIYFTIASMLIVKASQKAPQLSQDVIDKLTGIADALPQNAESVKARIMDIAGKSDLGNHENELLFPVIAFSILAVVIVIMTRKKGLTHNS